MSARGAKPDRKATGMDDGDLRDQIARLEAEIEELAKSLEGCRKVMLLSKVAIAAGGILILAYFIMRFDPTTVVGAIAVVIGGVVVLGSNLKKSKKKKTAM
jgi:hypothetical protein